MLEKLSKLQQQAFDGKLPPGVNGTRLVKALDRAMAVIERAKK
jgi:hypothetical protein